MFIYTIPLTPLLTLSWLVLLSLHFFFFLTVFAFQIWEYQQSIPKVRLQNISAENQQYHNSGEEDEIKVA